MALTELLYNVPPLYHMNLSEFAKHGARMERQYAVFSPLHRELALLPLTEFGWLTDDRMVQGTVFGDRVAIIANFAEDDWHSAGADVPARSVLVRRRGADDIVYTPGAQAD